MKQEKAVTILLSALWLILSPHGSLTAPAAERVMVATPSHGLFEFPVPVPTGKTPTKCPT